MTPNSSLIGLSIFTSFSLFVSPTVLRELGPYFDLFCLYDSCISVTSSIPRLICYKIRVLDWMLVLLFGKRSSLAKLLLKDLWIATTFFASSLDVPLWIFLTYVMLVFLPRLFWFLSIVKLLCFLRLLNLWFLL